jgi:hypothetical protein
MAERRRLTRMPDAEDAVEDWLVRPADDHSPRVWRVIRASKPEMVMAVGLWVGGEPARLGLPMRLGMALTSLTGAPFSPVLITIMPAVDWAQLSPLARQRAGHTLTEFLLSHPGLGDQVRALAEVHG